MRRKPKRGTKPALRMAARQSRIRLASAQMELISLIFVTPMATRSSGLLGKLPDLIAQQKTEESRLFGKVLSLWWTPATAGVPRVHRRFKRQLGLKRLRDCESRDLRNSARWRLAHRTDRPARHRCPAGAYRWRYAPGRPPRAP